MLDERQSQNYLQKVSQSAWLSTFQLCYKFAALCSSTKSLLVCRLAFVLYKVECASVQLSTALSFSRDRYWLEASLVWLSWMCWIENRSAWRLLSAVFCRFATLHYVILSTMYISGFCSWNIPLCNLLRDPSSWTQQTRLSTGQSGNYVCRLRSDYLVYYHLSRCGRRQSDHLFDHLMAFSASNICNRCTSFSLLAFLQLICTSTCHYCHVAVLDNAFCNCRASSYHGV